MFSRKNFVLLVLFCLVGLVVTRAQAGDGDLLDPDFRRSTFGALNTGIIHLENAGEIKDITVDSQNRTILAGETGTGNDVDFWVARYLPTGALDVSFGNNGRQQIDIAGGVDEVAAVAIQADDHIVIAGTTDDKAAVVRLRPTGFLDMLFGNGGMILTTMDEGFISHDVLIQPDGKIVVGGSVSQDSLIWGPDTDFGVLRYLEDGTLDPAFDGDGKLSVGFGDTDFFSAMTYTADDKIVLYGNTYLDDTVKLQLARIDTNDGSLDSTFDDDGKLVTHVSGYSRNVITQSDGRIIIYDSADSHGSAEIIRFNADGSHDTTFGNGGYVDIPDGYWGHGLIGLQNDYMLVLIHRFVNDERGLIVTRLDPDGAIDPTFGHDGVLHLVVGDPLAFHAIDGFALTADGHIMVGGHKSDSDITFLARLFADGSLDTGGRLSIDNFPYHQEQLNAVAFQQDGKAIVAGDWETVTLREQGNIGRINPDGTIDTTFGNSGWAYLTHFVSDGRTSDVVVDVHGRIVTVGYGEVNAFDNDDVVVWRHTADGTLDTTFFDPANSPQAGIVATDFGFDDDQAHALAIQPDGKLIVAGGANGDFALARYHPDGTLDSTFGAGGRVLSDLYGYEIAYDVVVMQDGRIAVVGSSFDGIGTMWAVVARYRANGALDTSFGVVGQGYARYKVGDQLSAETVVVEPNNQLVLLGTSFANSGTSQAAVWRISADGSLDTTFHGGGYALHDVDNHNIYARTLHKMPDGTWFVTGCMTDYPYQFVWGRLTSNGAPAAYGWGNAGFAEAHGDCVFGAALSPTSNDTLLVGRATIDDEEQIALLDVARTGSLNQIPVAQPDSFATPRNVFLTANIATNDSDGDGNLLGVRLVDPPSSGTLTFMHNNGDIGYLPNAGFEGTDTFTYRATDGIGVSAEMTVAIIVGDGAPTAVQLTTFTTHNATIPLLLLLALISLLTLTARIRPK